MYVFYYKFYRILILGKYMMIIIKVGRVFQLKNINRIIDFWDFISLRSKFFVKYVIVQGLIDMGMIVVFIFYFVILGRGQF